MQPYRTKKKKITRSKFIDKKQSQKHMLMVIQLGPIKIRNKITTEIKMHSIKLMGKIAKIENKNEAT